MNKQLLLAAPFILALGLGGGYWLGQHQKQESSGQPATIKKPLFYRSPMNPAITSPVPAKDSMGMDYLPVYDDAGTGVVDSAGTVKIDSATVQNMGVRTTTAKKTTLSHVVRAVGRVAYDEERIVRLHPKTEGWIETLRVNKTGQWVRKNDDLLSIYSPIMLPACRNICWR